MSSIGNQLYTAHFKTKETYEVDFSIKMKNTNVHDSEVSI
jgi:hypothetical protein